MKQGWEIKKLGEVSEILNGGTPKTNIAEYWDGDIHWITPADLGKLRKPTVDDTPRKITRLGLEKSSAKLFPINSVVLSTRAPIGHLAINEVPMSTNQGCRGIIPSKKLDTWYLYYFLKKNVELLDSLGTGATFKELSTKSLSGVEIPIPPLPEQQRIVSILDECFAAIDKAKANAEQNLKNAKELFESYLQGVFENKCEGWEEKTIGDIGSPKMCKRIFKEQTTAVGDIPFYKIGTFGKEPDAFISRAIYDEFRAKYSFPKKGDVLISASGTIGRRVRYDGEPAYFQDSNIVWIENDEKQVSNDFLYEFYGACNWGSTKGATISRLYNDNLKNIKITYPKSRTEQEKIVFQLETMRNKTQKLEAVYQKKIADLEELKKSILQKAFAGELTSSASASVSIAKVIPLQKVQGISPTDLQAGITAIALQRHSELNKHDSFGHVKAEKIVHLAEYILSIDLERNPVKDAAGPNDFPHAKKVESRAAKAGFYTVAKRTADQETGYLYTQGRSINSLVQKTQTCLGNKNDALFQLLELIVPMKTQQAEIVATIYAAWNNLILKGDEFNDEDIVTEARENWREEKLKIPKEKFFNAIEWMRKNELLIPKGNGKIVKAK